MCVLQGDPGRPGTPGLKAEKGEKGSTGKRGRQVRITSNAWLSSYQRAIIYSDDRLMQYETVA